MTWYEKGETTDKQCRLFMGGHYWDSGNLLEKTGVIAGKSLAYRMSILRKGCRGKGKSVKREFALES